MILMKGIYLQMDRECLSLSEQAKEGMRTHIKGFSLPVQLQASARALSGKTQTSQLTSQDTSRAFKDSALGSSTGLSSVGSSTGERLFER